jgi:hypothetical protein
VSLFIVVVHNFSCLLHDSDLLSLDDRFGLGFILATVYAWKLSNENMMLMIDDGSSQYSCVLSDMAIQVKTIFFMKKRIFELRREELDCIPFPDIERMVQRLVGKRFDFFLRILTFHVIVCSYFHD